ncbi:MAG: hypothetical protein K1X72_24550 [Pyrinomonadaceae bacterium]|nr:hypothetical protein [Pyrinomonadaceae bacterium]
MRNLIRYKSFLIGFLGSISLFLIIHIVNFLMIWGFWKPDAENYRTSISCFARYDFGFPFEFITWWSPTNVYFSFIDFNVDLFVMLFFSIAFGIISKAVISKYNIEDYKLR